MLRHFVIFWLVARKFSFVSNRLLELSVSKSIVEYQNSNMLSFAYNFRVYMFRIENYTIFVSFDGILCCNFNIFDKNVGFL